MNNRLRRAVLMALVLLVAAAVVFLFISGGSAGLDANEARQYVAAHHETDTAAKNAVTAVYLNYRYWDTLFESLILLVSALAVISLSWSSNKPE